MAAAVLSVLTALLLPLPGCGPSATDRALDRAEALMEEHPDSAKSILDSLAGPRVVDSPDYRLLVCEARWRLDSVPIYRSEMDFNPSQFGKNGNCFREMKACFLKSLGSGDSIETDKAIASAAKAYYIASDMGDDLWTARTLRNMADIYVTDYNQIKAAEYYAKSSDYFSKAGLERHALYSEMERATCLLNLNRPEESISILDSVRARSRAMKDTALEVSCLHSLVPANTYAGNLETAYRQIDSLKRFSEEGYYEYGNEALISETALLAKSGAFDSAKSTIARIDPASLSESEKIRMYCQLVKIGIKDGDSEFAGAVNDSIFMMQDRAIRRILDHYVMDSHNNLEVRLKNDAMERNDRLSDWIVILMLSILILLMLIFGVWHASRTRRRIKDLQLAESIADASMLRDSLREMEERLSGYDEDRKAGEERILMSLKDSYASSWDTLNEISLQYMNPSNAAMGSTSVRKLIEGLLQEMRRPEKLDMIAGTVDMNYRGAISRARDEFGLRKEAWLLLALSLSGLSPKSVSLLLGIDINYYYKKRKRILDRISASEDTGIRRVAEEIR